MNSIVGSMPKYDHKQHVLSDWLAELDQRFVLGNVEESNLKITWCQLLIGSVGAGILASLPADTTWAEAKDLFTMRMGAGSAKDEAWAALKDLKRNSRDILELAGDAEKLAKRLYPTDQEAVERHAIDAFLGALDKSLAVEVKKRGHRRLEDVVAQRIEKLNGEDTDSKV